MANVFKAIGEEKFASIAHYKRNKPAFLYALTLIPKEEIDRIRNLKPVRRATPGKGIHYFIALAGTLITGESISIEEVKAARKNKSEVRREIILLTKGNI